MSWVPSASDLERFIELDFQFHRARLRFYRLSPWFYPLLGLSAGFAIAGALWQTWLLTLGAACLCATQAIFSASKRALADMHSCWVAQFELMPDDVLTKLSVDSDLNPEGRLEAFNILVRRKEATCAQPKE